VIITVTVQNQA